MAQPPFQPFGAPGQPGTPGDAARQQPTAPYGAPPGYPVQGVPPPLGAPPAYGVPPYGVTQRPTVDGAVAAMVCGILGLVFCPILSIPGLVMGRRAMRRCDASGGYYDGRGLAQAGFITGLVGVLLWGAFIAFYVVLFVFIGVSGGFSGFEDVSRTFVPTDV